MATDLSNTFETRDLSRRGLLLATGVGLAGSMLLAPANAMALPDAEIAYYVSNDGDDTANGESPATAWATLERVKTSIGTRRIKRGQKVLFRAGDEWFGDITWINPAGDNEPPLVFSSYGSGAKPRISRFKICNDETKWKLYSPGVWQIDLSLGSGAYTGNVNTKNTNIGFIKVDGYIFGARKWQLSGLVARWDYFCDDQFLYVVAPRNPGTYTDFRAAPAGNIINAASSVTIRGLDLVGSGSHGVWISQSSGNVVIEDNFIREIGGSAQTGAYQTRFGNGVEIWIGSRNVTVRNNVIRDVYDAGVTMQGYQEGDLRGWTDCHVTSNIIKNCTQAFEVWSRGTDTSTGSGHVACSFKRNQCYQSGYSWGMFERQPGNGLGTNLLFYKLELPCDIQISENLFSDARTNHCYILTSLPRDVSMDANDIRLRRTLPIQHQIQKFDVTKSSSWVAQTGYEQTGRFTILESPPG